MTFSKLTLRSIIINKLLLLIDKSITARDSISKFTDRRKTGYLRIFQQAKN